MNWSRVALIATALAGLILIALAVAQLAVIPRSLAGTEIGDATAWVVADEDDAVVALDVTSGRVLSRISVAKGPRNIAASADGRSVVVTNRDAGRVTLIAGKTGQIAHVFSGFGDPYDVALSADGRYAYVTDKQKNELDVLDLQALRLVGSVAVGAQPQGRALGDRLWISYGREGKAALTAVDVSTTPEVPRVVGSVSTELPVHDVTAQPDSTNVFVTYWDSRFIGRADAGRGTLVFRKEAGKDVQHLAFDIYSGGRFWVTDHGANKVLVLSTSDGSVVKSLACPGARDIAFGAGNVAVSCRDHVLLVKPNFRGARMLRAAKHLRGVALTLTPR